MAKGGKKFGKRPERPASGGILLKKQYGQHFLRDHVILDHMIQKVFLDKDTSVFEIGCGDGFLTRAILEHEIARLWSFEIDPEWVGLMKKEIHDERFSVLQENILDVDFSRFEPYKKWVVLANLPYQITFPIFYLFQKHRDLIREGVVMVQEEVAQKICSDGGRDFGFVTLYFQHFFNWELMDKIPPTAFFPPPKVNSRLLYFSPKNSLDEIPDEAAFWQFIRRCFSQPRRTLKNNLQDMFDLSTVSEELLQLRAQQINKEVLLQLWSMVRGKRLMPK